VDTRKKKKKDYTAWADLFILHVVAAAAVQPSTLLSIIAVQTIRIVEMGRCFFLSFSLFLSSFCAED